MAASITHPIRMQCEHTRGWIGTTWLSAVEVHYGLDDPVINGGHGLVRMVTTHIDVTFSDLPLMTYDSWARLTHNIPVTLPLPGYGRWTLTLFDRSTYTFRGEILHKSFPFLGRSTATLQVFEKDYA